MEDVFSVTGRSVVTVRPGRCGSAAAAVYAERRPRQVTLNPLHSDERLTNRLDMPLFSHTSPHFASGILIPPEGAMERYDRRADEAEKRRVAGLSAISVDTDLTLQPEATKRESVRVPASARAPPPGEAIVVRRPSAGASQRKASSTSAGSDARVAQRKSSATSMGSAGGETDDDVALVLNGLSKAGWTDDGDSPPPKRTGSIEIPDDQHPFASDLDGDWSNPLAAM